jgi:hypothetical protein
MPLALTALSRNRTTGLYEISEDGITYGMELELTRQLKEDYKCFKSGTDLETEKYFTLARWYRDLPKEAKKQVKRSGNLPREQNDFYPDPEY